MKEFANNLFNAKKLTDRQKIEKDILWKTSASYYHCLHDLTYEELNILYSLVKKGWSEECQKW